MQDIHWPNHMLYRIFKYVRVSDRMKMHLVCRRTQELAKLRVFWDNVTHLSVRLERNDDHIVIWVFERKFTLDDGYRALVILFVLCPPLRSLEIALDCCIKEPQLLADFVDWLSQQAPRDFARQENTVSDLSYKGPILHLLPLATSVFGTHLPETALRFHLTTGPQIHRVGMAAAIRDVWRFVGQCCHLNTFAFHAQDFSFSNDAAATIATKSELRELRFTGRSFFDADSVHDMMKSLNHLTKLCPSLDGVQPPFFLRLRDTMLKRLTEIHIYLDYNLDPPELVRDIAQKLPNVRLMKIVAGHRCHLAVGVPLVRSFMSHYANQEEWRVISLWIDSVYGKNYLVHGPYIRRMCRLAHSVQMVANNTMGLVIGHFLLKIKWGF